MLRCKFLQRWRCNSWSLDWLRKSKLLGKFFPHKKVWRIKFDSRATFCQKYAIGWQKHLVTLSKKQIASEASSSISDAGWPKMDFVD
jgi:hypothetical protein